MEDMVILPKSDWVDILDGIKEKSGTTEPLKSGEVRAVVDSISAGGGDGGSNKLAQVVDRTITDLTAEDLEGVTKIGDYAFNYCATLVSISLPDSVKSIGERAFSVCSSLASVVFGENSQLTSMGDEAFDNCRKITSIDLPNGIRSLGQWAFNNCTGLTNITIPDSVTSIGNYAFGGCKGLTSVKMGSGVTSIRIYLFYNCTSMQEFDFSNCTSILTLSNVNAFTGVPSTCKFVLPDALYDEWINATNWSALTVNYVKKSEYVEGADV